MFFFDDAFFNIISGRKQSLQSKYHAEANEYSIATSRVGLAPTRTYQTRVTPTKSSGHAPTHDDGLRPNARSFRTPNRPNSWERNEAQNGHGRPRRARPARHTTTKNEYEAGHAHATSWEQAGPDASG